MSFDFPQQKKPRKSGINGGAMLLLICVALFFFMRSQPAGPSSPSGNEGRSDVVFPEDGDSEYGTNQDDSIVESQSSSGRKMPTGKQPADGDWSIEGIGSNGKSATESAKNSSAKKTVGQDGWSLEEVPTKKKDSGFNLKGSAKGNVEATEKSDWTIDDVDSKTKKTKEGDWSLEEVDPKRDK